MIKNVFSQERILIIEDSEAYGRILSLSITNALGLKCDIAKNLSETKKMVSDNRDKYFLSITDMNLPDCNTGDAVDYILSNNISCIVLSADLNEKIREELLKRHIIDYVIKKDKTVLAYIIKLIEKTILNQSKKILIVDDSKSSRSMISSLLKTRKFNVFNADNGKNALLVLEKNPDIDLIITDYNMPVMDGYELISKVRERYSKEELAIIGVSAQGSDILSARFLKNGANDFLAKPFAFEEFYLRIAQNLDILDYIRTLKRTIITDYLTGLYNRRYFFEDGEQQYKMAIRDGLNVSIAMIDIDYFKVINDTYGHDAGDEVLKVFSKLLAVSFSLHHLIARIGGEEFSVIIFNSDRIDVSGLFEKLRAEVEDLEILIKSEMVKFTISIGLIIGAEKEFEESLREADELLYESKSSGKNKIMTKVYTG